MLQSAVDMAFWSELGDLKLNTWRLSEEKVNLQGKTPCVVSLNNTASCTFSGHLPCRHMQLDSWDRHASICAAGAKFLHKVSSSDGSSGKAARFKAFMFCVTNTCATDSA